MKKRKLKNTFIGKKKGPEFHVPTHFQHTFIWEKKKKEHFQHTFISKEKKKEVEKLSNWQG